jgi:hypothetical protein
MGWCRRLAPVLQGYIQLRTKTLKEERLLGDNIQYQWNVGIGGNMATLTDKWEIRVGTRSIAL